MDEHDREHALAIQQFVDVQPTARWLLRLPVVRHIRAVIAWHRVDRHYATWASRGCLPVNRDLDDAVIEAIWRGEK